MAGDAEGGILIFEEGGLAGAVTGAATVVGAGCFGLKKSRMDVFLESFDMAYVRTC
jgi:hypothetical protein